MSLKNKSNSNDKKNLRTQENNSKIIINVEPPEQCRIALIKNGILEAFSLENLLHSHVRGNIYKGKLLNIEPSLQAVFIDIGLSKNAYLPFDEIHPEYYGYAENTSKIHELLKRGEELIVQVVKEETPFKGAAVTTYLSIPSRYLVLMPGTQHIGISRKIEDEHERKRLKNILKETKLPGGVGLIARTASQKIPKRDIQKDLRYLLRLWKELKKRARTLSAPALIYQDRDIVIRFLRDYLTSDIKEIIVDNHTTYTEIKNFLRLLSQRQLPEVKYHKNSKPIFDTYKLEEQIEQIFNPIVHLPSGGFIVIEPTEALVSIDVNSGKNIKEKDLEDTALKTNIEATKEIARQLRLRDLGGLIVIDFIDMKSASHRRQIVKQMRSVLKKDKARTEVGAISKFGLLEMVRQKIGSPIEWANFSQCPICKGRGKIISVEAQALSILRKVRSVVSSTTSIIPKKQPNRKILIQTTPDVAYYLLNSKRDNIYELEKQNNIKIVVEGIDQIDHDQYIVTEV